MSVEPTPFNHVQVARFYRRGFSNQVGHRYRGPSRTFLSFGSLSLLLSALFGFSLLEAGAPLLKNPVPFSDFPPVHLAP